MAEANNRHATRRHNTLCEIRRGGFERDCGWPTWVAASSATVSPLLEWTIILHTSTRPPSKPPPHNLHMRASARMPWQRPVLELQIRRRLVAPRPLRGDLRRHDQVARERLRLGLHRAPDHVAWRRVETSSAVSRGSSIASVGDLAGRRSGSLTGKPVADGRRLQSSSSVVGRDHDDRSSAGRRSCDLGLRRSSVAGLRSSSVIDRQERRTKTTKRKRNGTQKNQETCNETD